MAAFDRFFIPAVSLETTEGILSNLDGNGIRFEWDVTRDNTNKQDEGTITVFNLAPSLSGAIFEAWQALSAASGYTVVFSLGWDRIPQMVMFADVWDLVPDRRSPADVMTIFNMGDGNKPIRDQVVGRSFSKTKIDIVLDYLVSLPPASSDAGGGGLGLVYTPESKALVKQASNELPIQTWGNIPQGANVRDAIDIIMSTLGLEWRVQNKAFVVLRGGIINRPPVRIRPGTGLISYERRNDSGIVLSAFANPDVEPGSQILVQDDFGRPFGAGIFRVERIQFRGSTDGESLMQIQAAKALVL